MFTCSPASCRVVLSRDNHGSAPNNDNNDNNNASPRIKHGHCVLMYFTALHSTVL